MKILKIMSIIGIVFFSFIFFIISSLVNSDPLSAAGWGVISLFYAIPFSIVVLVISIKRNVHSNDIADQLIKLNDLKQKEIITEEEFNKKKAEALKFKL